jgi:hypothetical protein
MADAATPSTTAVSGRLATASAPAAAPNSTSWTTIRVGIEARHLTLGATNATQTTAASNRAPIPSTPAATSSPMTKLKQASAASIASSHRNRTVRVTPRSPLPPSRLAARPRP